MEGSPRDTRAKIICTLGPSSSTPETIRRMMLAGMNVTRHNFSHGTREDHKRLIDAVRQAAQDTGRNVAIMADLQGPKVRVGRFREGQAVLEPGAEFVITARDIEGTAQEVSTTYAGLPGDLSPGATVLLDDGLIQLQVTQVQGPDVHSRVLIGGVLKNNKGINLPGSPLSVEAITPKDYEDLDFVAQAGVDYIAMSFVRQAGDVERMRSYLSTRGAPIPIIAKIEKPQALEVIDDIISAADGIMVARGDLGVEMAPEEVPAIQKQLIAKCNQEGKPVITATQMLESMVVNSRPTRAEASDVANAVLDGSDAVMLSAESASGRYPVESVQVMHRIIRATENSQARLPHPIHRRAEGVVQVQVQEGIAAAACALADQVNAQAIACITLSGSMAKLISKHRASRPIFAISQHPQVLRHLAVYWGIEGIMMQDITTNIDEAAWEVARQLVELGKLQRGDRMILTAGLPFSERQATNMLRVEHVR